MDIVSAFKSEVEVDVEAPRKNMARQTKRISIDLGSSISSEISDRHNSGRKSRTVIFEPRFQKVKKVNIDLNEE